QHRRRVRRFSNDLVCRPYLVEQGARGHECHAFPHSNQGMRARNCAPTFSIGCVRSAFSSLEYLRRPPLFSALHLRANLPCWISVRILRISFLVALLTMRG